jgi:DNA-directed RNA polymerase subunit RPC12/RpoP
LNGVQIEDSADRGALDAVRERTGEGACSIGADPCFAARAVVGFESFRGQVALYNAGGVREMSVPCACCGREYDATLFEFGRTLWCMCGSRVGVEPRVRRVAAGTEVCFSGGD